MLLLGLPAGALADILDRRKLLLFWQSWMLCAAVLLALLGALDALSPMSLLLLTFVLNIGTALNNPAWQAIVPELVPRAQLAEAVSLNSAAFNLSRVLGPALGGLLLALFVSASVVFLLNALSFVFVIVILVRWRRKPTHTATVPRSDGRAPLQRDVPGRVLVGVSAPARTRHHAGKDIMDARLPFSAP